jgi:hypothetical protein
VVRTVEVTVLRWVEVCVCVLNSERTDVDTKVLVTVCGIVKVRFDNCVENTVIIEEVT